MEKNHDESSIRLKDLIQLGLPSSDVYLVHESADVGFVPAADLSRLSELGMERFARLLDAKVCSIGSGAYGKELRLSDVDPRLLSKYDQCLADDANGRMTGLFLPYGEGQAGALLDITSEGTRHLFHAGNIRSMPEALDLLWEVHTVPDRIPTAKGNDLSRLRSYSKSKLPVCTTPSMRLLQPVSAADFTEMAGRLCGKPCKGIFVKIDYDSDELAMADWRGERLEKTTSPLSAALSAYGDAVIRRSRKKIQFRERQFVNAMEALCTVTPVESPADLCGPEPDGPAMTL